MTVPAPTESRRAATERRGVEDLIHSLSRKFPTLSPDDIRVSVQRTHDSFDGCRIRDYLTVLTEKAVKVELAAACRTPPEQPRC